MLWAGVLASLISAWCVSWAGTWWGVDAYRLLHDPPADLAAAGTAWLAWTAPDLGGTLLAYALSQPLMTKR